jgi:hypothetical protein
MKYITENYRAVTVDGRKRIMFDVRKVTRGCRLFCGTFTAPPRTAKRDLLDFTPYKPRA